jgi:membrane associated rhomboid family serine protease
MEMFAAYINPEIMAACLVLGFIIKKWVKDVDNKWIPTIVAVVGLILAIMANLGSVTISVAVGGALSGLASTGLHQLFKQWIDNGGK